MTKASSIAALIGVWTAGLAAAAAAYTVHKPPVPPADPRVSVAEVQSARSEDPAALEELDSEEEVMMMPADTIVASAPRAVRPLPVRAELRCAGWVDLAQGPVGAQVRYCE